MNIKDSDNYRVYTTKEKKRPIGTCEKDQNLRQHKRPQQS